MKLYKRKMFFLSVFIAVLIIIVSLPTVLFLQGRKFRGKLKNEICVARNCLLSIDERKPPYTASLACIPENCVLKEDVPEDEKVCVPKDCSVGRTNATDEICLEVTCLVSAREARFDARHICITEDCVLAASEVLNMLDYSMDPCYDFYNFSCGRFFHTHAVPEEKKSYNAADEAEEKVALRVKEILEFPIKNEDSDALKKAKIVYRSCMNSSHSERYSVEELKLLMSSKGVGGWPVLERKWNDCRLDLEWRMAKLNSRGVDSFLRLYIEPKGKERRYTGSIYISPPLVDVDCEEYNENSTSPAREAYKELMRRVLSLLGAPVMTREEDIQSVMEFDALFCNITTPSREASLNKNSNQTLQELISIAPQINWSRWYSIIFSELGLNSRSDRSPIYLYNVDKSIEGVIDILFNTSARTLANYLSWKFVFHHLGFLGQSFRQVIADHKAIFDDRFHFHHEIKSWMPKWKQCEKYVERLMTVGLIPPYLTSLMSRDLQNEMTFIVSSVKESFKDTFKKTPNLFREVKTQSVNKIENMRVRLFYPDRNAKFFENYYSQIRNLGYSFLDNGMKVSLHHLRKAFEAVLAGKSVFDLEHTLLFENPFTVNAWSAFPRGYIVLYFAVIQSTGISSKRPKYLNFASFGTLIGHEFTHGFDLASINGDTGFNELPLRWINWPEYARRYVERKTDCFAEQLFDYATRYLGEPHNRVLREIVADSQGIHEAYKAYKLFLANHGMEKALPGLNYTTILQVFFTKYAQSFCSLDSANYFSQKENRQRVNSVLRNIDDFSRVFGCNKGSPMNPAKKCKSLW